MCSGRATRARRKRCSPPDWHTAWPGGWGGKGMCARPLPQTRACRAGAQIPAWPGKANPRAQRGFRGSKRGWRRNPPPRFPAAGAGNCAPARVEKAHIAVKRAHQLMPAGDALACLAQLAHEQGQLLAVKRVKIHHVPFRDGVAQAAAPGIGARGRAGARRFAQNLAIARPRRG